jgi:ubiquinone/menaquinone biosynthesis C-methylase UbiE
MGKEPWFATDLYQGTAGHYDRYRLPYPEAMTRDLIQRAGVSGDGRLLDLACGTGQLAFPLRRWFSEVWAVDREPDMVRAVRAKAEALGAGNIRPVVADAETLGAQPGHFELAVIGNAFHRLDRDLVAARLLGWLRPGGCVAVCWSDAPHLGGEEWQRALAATVDRWVAALGAADRVPRTGTSRGGCGPITGCWPTPASRWPDARSSPSSTGGACRNWPALSGRPRFFRQRSWATRGRSSTRTSRQPSARSLRTAPSPRP